VLFVSFLHRRILARHVELPFYNHHGVWMVRSSATTHPTFMLYYRPTFMLYYRPTSKSGAPQGIRSDHRK
ncbi:MAG: hypothetical protein JWN19_2499, partial [Arthrobacter sp.]|nr:hypothetical protein [Arthrobacter sp.]